jgi:hypothetical protein
MAIQTSNVNIVTDSFQNWVEKTNTLLYGYSTYTVTAVANTAGSITTGNAVINGTFVSNSVVVSGTGTFGLRGGTLTTSNVLYVTSNVSIGNTTVNTVINTAGINTQSITASGNATIGGLANITGNVTIGGTSHTVGGNVNIDSGTLYVDSVNNRVGINNTAPGVALHVTGQANITGNTTVGGILTVAGNTAFTGTVQYTGGVGFSNSVSVVGNVTFSNTLAVTGNTTIGNTLAVVGNATFSNTVAITGNVVMSNTLAVTGNVTISNTLNVSGNVVFDSGSFVLDSSTNRLGVNTASPTVALEVTGDTKITGMANVSANLQVGGDLIITGNVVVTGSIGGGSSGVSSGGGAQTFNANTTAVLIGNSTANGYILLGSATSSYTNNDLVIYIANGTSTPLGGLVSNTGYYVLTTNSTAIQLVSTTSNAAINISSVTTSPQTHYLISAGAQVRGSLAVSGNTTLANLNVVRAAEFANNVNAASITTRNFLMNNGGGDFNVTAASINFYNGVNFASGLGVTGDVIVNTSTGRNVILGNPVTANSTLVVNGAVSFANKKVLTNANTITFVGNNISVLIGNSSANGFIPVSTAWIANTSNNDIITYSVGTGNTVIGGLANNTDYYVITTNVTHMQLAATPGGAAINLTSAAATSQPGHFITPKMLTVRGGLGVTGLTTVGNNLIVAGNTTIGGSLSIGGTTAFTGTTQYTGQVTFGNTLSVAGASAFTNTLAVTGGLTLSNTLSVAGATTLSNTLSVTGAVTFSNGVTFNLPIIFNSDITTTANMAANQMVVALGNMTANSTTLKIGNNTSGVITVGNTTFLTNTALSIYKTYASDTSSYGESISTVYNNATLTAARQHYSQYIQAFANTLSANSTNGNPGNELFGSVVIAKNATTEMGTENSRLTTLGGASFEARNAAGGTTANTIGTATGVSTIARSFGRGIISTATGLNSSVLIGNSTVTGNITTAYGVSSTVQSNTLGTITTGYLYYGAHTGANTTNKFGLYLTGESNNYLSGNLNVVGVTNLANNVTMGGNIIASGTSHTLAGNVNIDAGTFYVDAVNNRVGINNTAPTLALQVTGAANVTGNATIGSILAVSGNAAITGNTTITGLTTLSGNATLSGALQTIAGNVNIDSGTLFVDSINNRVGINNTAPTVSLQVTGTSNVTGAAVFGNTLNLTGGATFANTLAVTGAATFSNTVSVTGAITFSGALGAGNTTITGYANATGNLNANGLNIALGNITANATTLIIGNTTSGTIGIGNSTPSTYAISVNKVYPTDNDWGGHFNVIQNSNVAHAAGRYIVGGYDLIYNNSQNRTSAAANLNSSHYASLGQFFNANTAGANARTYQAFGGYFATFNQAGGTAANTIDLAHGTISIVGTNSTGTINTAFGAKSLITGSSSGNIGVAHGVYSSMEPAGTMRIGTGYLMYGSYGNTAQQAQVTGDRWGVFVTGDTKNYMNGALQVIGAVNTSTSFTVGTISASNGTSIDTNAIRIGNSTVNTVITSSSISNHTTFRANATGMYSTGLANATLFQSSNATHIGSIGFASGVRIGTTTVNSSMTDVLISIANTTVSTSIAKEYILATNANTSIKSLSVGGATLGAAGEIRALNNITAFAPSDAKFKENIEDIKGAVDIVSQIGGKTFDWTHQYIDDHGGEDGYFVVKHDFGVIAQDVEKAFPLAVRTRQDGTLAVDYEKLSALAFAAIIELKQEIEELKNGNKG